MSPQEVGTVVWGHVAAGAATQVRCCKSPAAQPSPATTQRPRGYWGEKKNRREFLDALGGSLKIERPEDWARVRRREIEQAGGRGLLYHYRSVGEALKDIYPEYDWDGIRCRPKTEAEYWTSDEQCRLFLDGVLARSGAEGWHEVTRKDIVTSGGKGLLDRFGSLYKALVELYPSFAGAPLSMMRNQAPNGYWDDVNHRRRFLDSVAADHDVTCKEDWAKVKQTDVVAAGGGGLLSKYPSFFAALQHTYGGEWDEFKVRRYRKGEYWDDLSRLTTFLEETAAPLGVSSLEDWARVSNAQFIAVGGGPLLSRMSLHEALTRAYPKTDWNALRRAGGRNKRADQRWMKVALGNIFSPHQEPSSS